MKKEKKEHLKAIKDRKTKIDDGTITPRSKSLVYKNHLTEFNRLGEL